MSGNDNNKRLSTTEKVAAVAVAAGISYGAFKLFSSFFDSPEPQPDKLNEGRRLTKSQYHSESAASTVYVVESIDELRDPLKKLKSRCETSPVLGFDCEWNSEYTRRPVALLQLCTYDGLVVLIRLSKLRHIPYELKELLEDRSVVKVGVAPYTDAKHLHHDYGVTVTGTLDLRYMARLSGLERTAGRLGKMCEHFLGYPLDKSEQCSDWEVPKLSSTQIHYARTDVEAAMDLFKYFADRIAPNKSPNDVLEYCFVYIGRNYGPLTSSANEF